MSYNNYPNMISYHPQNSVAHKNGPVPLHPVVQPPYVNQLPASYTPIYPIPAIPQPSQYVTPLNPVFIDHLSRHEGHHIVAVTTAGKVEGKLAGVAVDHIQINLSKENAVHIRIDQIVYFEGFPISYR